MKIKEMKSRRIRLASGHYAIVDAEDYEKVRRYKWHRQKGRHTFYARRSGGMSNGVRGPSVYLHRQVLEASGKYEVDHKNGNGLDCRKTNLIETTRSKNALNNRVSSNSSTRVKGVTWSKNANKYMAKITVDGKQKYLGYFKTIQKARKIVEQARVVALNQGGSWQS